jgi:hypothetical protein
VVPDSIADAVHYASDHLPLTARFVFSQGTITQQYAVNAGWNIVSLPLTVSDPRKTTVFPAAISPAFAFSQSSGYIIRDTLRYGEAYWLKFSASQNVSITGALRSTDSIQVLPGWNLIGSISSPVPAGSIAQIPPGIVSSNFFGYSGAYAVADTIRPGNGYWVKVSQSGVLVLE